jgi:hypothetical protein
VSDMEDADHVPIDVEQDSIDVRSTAVEKLANFHRGFSAFWSDRTTGRKGPQRADRLAKRREPLRSRITGILAYEPGVNRNNV